MAPTQLSSRAAEQGFLCRGIWCRLRCGDFFGMYSDLIHAGRAGPLSLPSDSWRKMGFLGLANFRVTYHLTKGIHVPLWAFEKQALVSAKPRCAMEKCRKTPTETCFACKTSPLCEDHAAGLCPACKTLQPQPTQHDTLTPDQQIRVDCGITCYVPVDTIVLYSLRHPLPEQRPSLFRANLPAPTFKAAECYIQECIHGAKHPPPASDTNLTLPACQPSTIVPTHQRFGGIAAVRGSGEQVVV